MDFENNSKVQALVTKLSTKINSLGLKSYDTSVYQQEIYNALLEYYNDRHYTPTNDKPFEDIYSGIIVQLALYAISKFGAEGENHHSEGGLIRTYENGSDYPASLTKKIIPLAKGVG